MLLLMLGLSISLAESTFDPEVMCSLLMDGTKIKDPRACNAWIICENGKPIQGACDADQYYSREDQECVPSDSIECITSNPCLVVGNGFSADPYTCNSYYYCVNGVGTLGLCSSGFNFNPLTNACLRNFECIEKMMPESYCNIVPDGVFIKSTTSCTKYQMCWKGNVIENVCPGTFYFNLLSGQCDYPENVACDIVEDPLIAEPGQCSADGEFVPDGSTCNGYYYCHLVDGQMHLRHGECAKGRFFSDGACRPRAQVSCAYDRCAGLGESNFELANESEDGCTSFTICENGVSIGSGHCPDNQYFDEVLQKCTHDLVSYPACKQAVTSTAKPTSSTTQASSAQPTSSS